MPLFCSTCQNLMIQITTADTFIFKCEKCETTEQPNDIDSLRYEHVNGTSLSNYKAILHNAGKDAVNLKVYKQCIECSNNIVRQVRLGDEMRLINTCTVCNKQWLDNTQKDD